VHSTSPYFTVFTPTYNRAHTLHGVYKSLCDQTFTDFEWVIVDDGSEDTTERLVREWERQNKILIRYFKQENQGKHSAHNFGVDNANGYLFLVFDSDDRCVPSALETFRYYWEDIPVKIRSKFSTLSCLCMNHSGHIIGPEYPSLVCDIFSLKKQLAFRSGGGRWGVNTVQSMRENKFPIFAGETFIPESLIWNRISSQYGARFINKPLRIVESLEGGLSATSVSIRIKSPRGTLLTYNEQMSLPLGFGKRMRSALNYVRFSIHARCLVLLLKVTLTNPMVLLALPGGVALYCRDKFNLTPE